MREGGDKLTGSICVVGRSESCEVGRDGRWRGSQGSRRGEGGLRRLVLSRRLGAAWLRFGERGLPASYPRATLATAGSFRRRRRRRPRSRRVWRGGQVGGPEEVAG